MKILRPICWFKTFLRTPNPLDIPISGHDYTEVFNDGKLSILICDVCDHVLEGNY